MVAWDVVCVIIQRAGDPVTKRELACGAREKITVQRKV
jgi:hypothetical protein